MYTSPNMESMKGFNFYDAVPLILCIGFDGEVVKGFNFNYIPTDARAAILDSIVDSNPEFYSSALDGDGNFKVNTTLGSVLIDDNGYNWFVNLIKFKTGVDISKTLRTYSRKNVKKCRLIEYDMWKYIPYLVFKDAIRGANLAEVQLATIDK